MGTQARRMTLRTVPPPTMYSDSAAAMDVGATNSASAAIDDSDVTFRIMSWRM